LKVDQWGLIIYFLFTALMPFIFGRNAYVGFLLILLNFYIVLAGSWNIVAGYAGQLSFAHPGLLAIGAYASVIFVSSSHNPPLGLLVGGIAATAMGLVIGAISLRLKGIYFVLATFGFSSIFFELLVSENNITGGYAGYPTLYLLQASPYVNFLAYYYISAGIIIAFFLSTYYLVKGRLGLFMRSVRDDEDAASVYGVNITRVKLTAFALSSFWTGVMGSFYAHLIGYATPSLSGLSEMVNIVFIAVLGGLGGLFGPILGGFVVWPISIFLRTYNATLNVVLFSLVMIIVLKFFPNGLEGFVRTMVKRSSLGRLSVRGLSLRSSRAIRRAASADS